MPLFGYGPITDRVGGYGHPWQAANAPPILPEQTYDEAAALSMLRRRDRCVRYLCHVLTPDLVRVGSLAARGMRLDCNSNAEIPTSMWAVASLSDAAQLDFGRARLQPAMQLLMPDGGWYEWPLGVFVPTTPRQQHGHASRTMDIAGYDMTIVVRDDKLTDALTIPAGAPYIDTIITLLMQSGIQHIIAERTDVVLVQDLQYDIGTEKLTIVNALLKAINYMPLYSDASGYLRLTRQLMPYERAIRHQYVDDELSVLTPDMGLDLDMYDAPNVIVAVVSRPDAEPLVARWTNNDPMSPLSTVRRGRRVVRMDELDDILDQDALERYVIAEGYRTMARYGQVSFETLNMPGHLVRDMLFLQRRDADLSGRYMEVGWSMDLRAGATMRHTVQRVVTI